MVAMAVELCERDLRGAMSTVQALADHSCDCRSFILSALDQLTGIVASDLTTLSVCDLKAGTRKVFGRASETLSDADRVIFDRYFHKHPLVRFHGDNPSGTTRRISDCVDSRTFNDSPLYADYYRRIGINYVMALPLQIDRQYVVSIVFNRCLSDFADSERALLDAIRQPLSAFYRNLVARQDAGVDLRSIANLATHGGWQMIRVTVGGRILEAAAPALDLLQRFFPHEMSGHASQLPATLSGWLSRSRSWGLERPAMRHGQQFVISRLGSKLTVHVVPDPADDGTGYLLMKPTRVETSASQLSRLPVTKREREVLAFIAVGKTNAEIATILSISPRTVQKHLEHIFQKLGIETRTAAAVCALTAADEQSGRAAQG